MEKTFWVSLGRLRVGSDFERQVGKPGKPTFKPLSESHFIYRLRNERGGGWDHDPVFIMQRPARATVPLSDCLSKSMIFTRRALRSTHGRS